MIHARRVLVTGALVAGAGCADSTGFDTAQTSPDTAVLVQASGTPQSSTTIVTPTVTPVTTTLAPTTTSEAISTSAPTPSTSAAAPARLTVTGDGFLGIRQFSPLTDAAEALGASAHLTNDATMGGGVSACVGTPQFWVIREGGLTLVFEGASESDAILTNWSYVGGSVSTFEEMVVAPDITVGDSRDELFAAFSASADLVDVIDVYQPFSLRFGVDGETISWFGIVDCAMEG